MIDKPPPQMGMTYLGWLVSFVVVGLPIGLVIAVVTELVWKRKNLVIIPGLLAIIASFVVFFYSGDMKSSVGNYFAVFVFIMTFFLPFVMRALADSEPEYPDVLPRQDSEGG